MDERSIRVDSSASEHFLSIDVDDYVLVCHAHFNPGSKVDPRYETPLVRHLWQVLDLLSECRCRATFFVCTSFLQKNEEGLERIVADGHVLGSHGHQHYDFTRVSIQDFEEDTKESLRILSRYQRRILGYRPPAFTMPYDNEHLRILSDLGIEYVSSGVGFSRSDAPYTNVPIPLPYGLTHFPISTKFILRNRIKYPIGYGVTSRLLPECIYLMTLKAWLKKHSFFHYYAHPFEIAGFQGMGKKWLPREARNYATFLYYLRSKNRGEFFRRLFEICRFSPIESYLSKSDTRGVADAG